MTHVDKRLPYHCLPDFFEIVYAYGAYIKERDIVRKMNKSNEISDTLSRSLSLYTVDIYSSYYREYGMDYGITESSKNEIEKNISDIIEKEKELRTKNLISSQKYYKKLKHEFKEKNPTLIKEFNIELVAHQKNIENKKKYKYHKETDLIKLSSRFISFFNYHFGGADGLKIAYKSFSSDIIKRTDSLGLNEFEIKSLNDKIYPFVYKDKLADCKLNQEEIETLASALKILLSTVTKEDLVNVEKYIRTKDTDLEEKKKLVKHIINKNINRFTSLLNDYNKILNR